jgi:dihydrofolate reductase
MRSLVLSSFLSLDGYSFDPGTEIYQLLEDIDDPEQDEYFVGRLRAAGTHIMGRVTYEEMAKAWPGSDLAIAGPMNEIPKVVFSSTLASADWTETRIARGDTADEIARLKAEPGGDIIAHGGMAFAHSLISLGLVDEYRLWLLPAAAGDGVPLFAGLTPLRLLTGRTFPSGLIELCYAPAGTDK